MPCNVLQDLEREKAARSELEKTAYIHSSAASDQTPITKHNSGFENGIMPFLVKSLVLFLVSLFICLTNNFSGSLSRKLSTASSQSSMEESQFLQASLDSSEILSERRSIADAPMGPYIMKSMNPSAYEVTLRQKEGELASYMSRLVCIMFYASNEHHAVHVSTLHMLEL